MAKRSDTDFSPWDDFDRSKRRLTPREEMERAERSAQHYRNRAEEIRKQSDKKIKDIYYRAEQKKKIRAFDYKAKGLPLTRDQRFITGDDNRKDRAVRAIAKKGAKVAGRALGAAGAASELALPDKTEGRKSDLAAQKARIRGGGGKVKYSQSSRADAVKAIQRERARRKK